VFDILGDSRTIHFIGIGGIGVSGLAEILHAMGYNIQGSDCCYSQNIERLERLGITALIGHDISNINNVDVVVYSSAIGADNPELLQAKARKIPCLTRAEMLSQIVRLKKSIVVAGSHGKTTTTSLCAAILEVASLSPTVVNGGIINAYKTNAKLGSGNWAVVESDESDGSFVKLIPTIGIVTNIDKEHTSYYGSYDNLKLAFKSFLNNIPFYGAGIVCIDDDSVEEIVMDIADKNILTYSINKRSMFQATNIRKTQNGTTFDILMDDKDLESVYTPLLGDHNILNTLAAIATAKQLKISPEMMKTTLASFSGIGRRFSTLGMVDGVIFVDDYAHHPTEIAATISSAKQKSSGKIVVICQPHRFTRLLTLFDEFCKCFDLADVVIVTEVYKADDTVDSEISSKNLYDALTVSGKNVMFAEGKDDLLYIIKNLIKNNGDILLFVGAGSISKWAHEIYGILSR
jgi:UDP-N-acetylmuramate--alanine ligase